MEQTLSPHGQRFQEILRALGCAHQVMELPYSTRTAAEAAHALGCRVEQIAKSLVFRGTRTHKSLLIIASGGNRVNEQAMEAYVGEPIEKADAEFIRQRTGFAIGGVPPVGHAERLETLIDKDLRQYEDIWAAAGTPNALFRLTFDDLVRMTDGRVVAVT
ncbi:MAG: YbaK/EbsC family protein [Candidatus Latescibacteria bacterium]|nr:YbaK/EbsC family protein [Candidatus Latescibacterota bacterium]